MAKDWIYHWVHDDRDNEDFQIGMFDRYNCIAAMRCADTFLTGHFTRSWLEYHGKVIYEGENWL